jgi:hypothetical protein
MGTLASLAFATAPSLETFAFGHTSHPTNGADLDVGALRQKRLLAKENMVRLR